MNLQKIIDKRDEMTKYAVAEITHICKTFGKRDPGSEGERKACEYMADVLKNECGCETVKVESFEEHPGAFYGWLYFTITMVLAAAALFFVYPLVSAILCALGLFIMIMEFGLYKKCVDIFFKKKTGHNVYAVKKCTGEVKRRIMFNGHPDAAWEWPVNYLLGGVGFEAHAIIAMAGTVLYLVFSIIYLAISGAKGIALVPDMTLSNAPWVVKAMLVCLIFVPFQFGLYFMCNTRRVVDGANDNLTGCYMGICLLKALHDEGIELENTEIGCILTGSEESGLRGAEAWSKAHKHDFDDVPTFIIAYDTIHDPDQLMVNYRDLNGTVKADKEVSDLFYEAAVEAGVPIKKGMVPPMGGSTDSAAFTKGGFRSTGITGLNHKLEDYYHTRRDTYDNLNETGISNCYAATVKCLEKFDNGEKTE